MAIAKYDLDAMNNVATKLEDLIQEWNSKVEDLYTNYDDLDKMWDGTANDAFNKKFITDDREKYKTLSEALTEYLNVLKDAINTYTQAEDQISSMFN